MTREVLLSLPGGPTTVRLSGEGPALVWTHGLFHPPDVEDHTLFGQVLSSLSNVQVIRFDSRGYGPTAVAEPDEYRWALLGEDVLALADALELDTFVAAGFSMGVAASLHAAVRNPARVRAMVLLAPPNAWGLRPAQAEEFRDSARLVRAQGIEALLAAFDGQRPVPAGMAGAQAKMFARLRALPPDAIEGILRGAAASDLPAVEVLRRLDVPALVYAFEGDPGHPAQVAHELAAALPRSTLRSLAQLDEAATVTREVQTFLDALG